MKLSYNFFRTNWDYLQHACFIHI